MKEQKGRTKKPIKGKKTEREGNKTTGTHIRTHQRTNTHTHAGTHTLTQTHETQKARSVKNIKLNGDTQEKKRHRTLA